METPKPALKPSHFESKPDTSISPNFSRRVIITGAIGVLLVALAYVVSHVIQVLLFIFGGILLALFLRSIAQFITRHTGLWPRVSLAMVVLLFAGIVASVAYFAGPQLVSQANMLADNLPKSIATIRKELASYSLTRPFIHSTASPAQLSVTPQKMLSGLPGIFSTTTEALALMLLSVFVGIYAAADPRLYLESLLHLVPPSSRERFRQVGNRLHSALGWWLVGRVITMTLMGIFTTIGLWVIHMPMALPLGFISGLFQFVPYLGAFIAAAPAVILGFVQSPSKALEVALLYLIVHSVEGYLVTPIIQQRAVSLPPAALISVQLIMGALFGITGVIFATPVAVAVIVLVQTLYLHDVLNDPVRVLGQ